VVTASGPTTASTVTDGTGAFTLGGLAVGSYTVTAGKDPEWQPSSTPGLTVTRDGTTTLADATLPPRATASIAGVVALEGGAAGTGTTVSLTGTDFRGVAVSAATPAGAAGAFSFGSLVAGSYQVFFSRASYDSPPPVGVSVVTGQAASVGTVRLSVSRGTIAGTVALSSSNVAGLFGLGSDRSGIVVTLSGTDVPGCG
jgi:hypothetical protein